MNLRTTSKTCCTLLKTFLNNKHFIKSGDSSVNHFLFITNNIYKSFDVKIEIRGVVLDISKAFDKVRHEGLLRKLKQRGISDDALNLMRDFLYERQRTIFSVFYLYHD